MKDDTSRRDDLADLHKKLDETLSSASQAGKNIRERRGFTAECQAVSDWADATRDAFSSIDDAAVLGHMVQDWERVNWAAFCINPFFVSADYRILSSTTFAASVRLVLNLGQAAAYVGYNPAAFERIRELAARPEMYASVLQLLKDLGFDQAPSGTISAYQRFEAAYEEFRGSVTSAGQATTWLIPIRECILSLLGTLLRQTRHQEKQEGTTAKVLFILKQLARDGSEPGHIENLAEECEIILNDKLPSSKQTLISRADGEDYLMAATMWLKSFLVLLVPETIQRAAR